MTTATPEPCGHRWTRTLCLASGYSGHLCDRAAGHQHNLGLVAYARCRCRCGATTTTREETR